MNNKITKICMAVAILLLAVLIFIPKNKSKLISYDTVPVKMGTITNSVTATGTLKPTKEVEVGTQVSGIIEKIYVDYNSIVKEGQIIAELDRETLQAELDASQANLNASKIEFDYQTINYNRTKGLHEKGLISDSEYEQAEYSFSKAETSYRQATANYKKAVRNIGYATIYAPIDGVVLSRSVDEGQTVASGFSTPTLFNIANDLTKMEVIANVDEADIGQVKEGQNVDFTVDAFPDIIFKGTVQQVRLQAITTSNVVTYEVVIDAPNPDQLLMPGLTASVTIYTLIKENIPIVSTKALRFIPDNYDGSIPEICLWEQNGEGTVVPIPVTTGATDGIFTEITSGVNVGKEVITGKKIEVNRQKKNSRVIPEEEEQGPRVRTE